MTRGRLAIITRKVAQAQLDRAPVLSSSTERTRGTAWMNIRRKVLRDAKGQCAMCGKAATVIDHITPLHLGGKDDGNLQALCLSCHNVKTADEMRDLHLG